MGVLERLEAGLTHPSSDLEGVSFFIWLAGFTLGVCVDEADQAQGLEASRCCPLPGTQRSSPSYQRARSVLAGGGSVASRS
jgi:hypothetical protein